MDSLYSREAFLVKFIYKVVKIPGILLKELVLFSPETSRDLSAGENSSNTQPKLESAANSAVLLFTRHTFRFFFNYFS